MQCQFWNVSSLRLQHWTDYHSETRCSLGTESLKHGTEFCHQTLCKVHLFCVWRHDANSYSSAQNSGSLTGIHLTPRWFILTMLQSCGLYMKDWGSDMTVVYLVYMYVCMLWKGPFSLEWHLIQTGLLVTGYRRATVGSSLKETVFREQFLVTHLQVLPRIELGHSVSAMPLTGNSGWK